MTTSKPAAGGGAWHLREGLDLIADARDRDPEASTDDVLLLLRFAEMHLFAAQVIATAHGAGLVHGGDHPTDWHRAIHGEGRP